MLTAVWTLSVMVLVSGGSDLLSRSKAVTGWLERQDQEHSRQTRTDYVPHGNLQTPEEKVLYEDLPRIDFSKGGVYFFGSSIVERATKLWSLPPALQVVTHNFAMSACNQESELVWLQYLIEQRGMLKAGGEKNLVLLGTTYHNVFYPPREVPPSFADSFVKHGLFSCDGRRGIQPQPVNAVSEFVDFEETRQAVCMTRWRDALVYQVGRWRGHGVEPVRPQDPALYMDWRRQEMGTNWRKKIYETMPVFRETIDYLRARHAPTIVILMPLGTWENGLPYDAEYRRQVTALCAEEHIPVVDWAGLLADEDFADSAHYNIFGTEKVHPAFLKIAIPFLQSSRVFPDAESQLNRSPNRLERKRENGRGGGI